MLSSNNCPFLNFTRLILTSTMFFRVSCAAPVLDHPYSILDHLHILWEEKLPSVNTNHSYFNGISALSFLSQHIWTKGKWDRFEDYGTRDRMSKNRGLGRGVLHGFHCVLLCRSAVCKSAYCIVAATFNIMQCAASCDVMLLVMSVMKTLLHVTMDWNTPSPPTLPPTRPIHYTLSQKK